MAMSFPMDNTNDFSSAGGFTGAPLQHCVDNVNEVQDVPFPKHFPNQPGATNQFQYCFNKLLCNVVSFFSFFH